MLKKEITYTDYDGNERTETHYFNLSKAEMLDMELFTEGGYANMLERVMKENDQVALIKLFKELVMKSYGKKSDDGRRFMKSQEILDDFMQSEAFSVFYMELATSSEAAAEFANGIMPADLRAEVEKIAPEGVTDLKTLAALKLGKEEA